MRSIRHRRGRILWEMFGALFVGSTAVGLGELYRGSFGIRLQLLGFALVFYGLYRTTMLFKRNPALEYNDSGVRVGRFFRVSSYRWDQVRDIRESSWKPPSFLRRGRFFLLSPVTWLIIQVSQHLLVELNYVEMQFHSEGRHLGGAKFRVDMIDLPDGGVKRLIADLRAKQAAVLGDVGAARARLGVGQAAPTVAPVSGVQAERWQRLGIGGAATDASDEAAALASAPAAPQNNLPPRAVFGRKAG